MPVTMMYNSTKLILPRRTNLFIMATLTPRNTCGIGCQELRRKASGGFSMLSNSTSSVGKDLLNYDDENPILYQQWEKREAPLDITWGMNEAQAMSNYERRELTRKDRISSFRHYVSLKPTRKKRYRLTRRQGGAEYNGPLSDENREDDAGESSEDDEEIVDIDAHDY